MDRVEEVRRCYERHGAALARFAVSLVGATDGPDVLAAGVVAALESRTERIDDMTSYLYRTVHRAALKHWRTNHRRIAREQRLWAPECYEMATVDPEIAIALEQMSRRQRAVVHLAYWEDLSTRQIAARLAIPEGAVKRHRTRAHEKLSEALHALA